MIYQSDSSSKTQKIAAEFAKQFEKRGGVIALSGQLGAGKTSFAAGFAKGLKIKDKILSPTFVLIRQHQIPSQKRMLFHIDLYRLEGRINLKELGIAELIKNPENIVLIEWAEKVKDQLKDFYWINIKKTSENDREIEVIQY